MAVIEPRSNTMRLGVHKANLAPATEQADEAIWYQPPGLDWDLQPVVAASKAPARVASDLEQLVQSLVAQAKAGDHIVIMSNGGFGGIHRKLLQALQNDLVKN